MVPITTHRLVIRALTEADVDAVFAILGDAATTAGVSWGQPTLAAAGAWLTNRMRDERDHDMSMWAVEDRTGDVIGLCGFFPRGEPQVELGYVIHARLWRQGFATEAVVAILRAASQAGQSIYATIRPPNTASIRVAEKAGLRLTGEVEDDAGTLLVYSTS